MWAGCLNFMRKVTAGEPRLVELAPFRMYFGRLRASPSERWRNLGAVIKRRSSYCTGRKLLQQFCRGSNDYNSDYNNYFLTIHIYL